MIFIEHISIRFIADDPKPKMQMSGNKCYTFFFILRLPLAAAKLNYSTLYSILYICSGVLDVVPNAFKIINKMNKGSSGCLKQKQ